MKTKILNRIAAFALACSLAIVFLGIAGNANAQVATCYTFSTTTGVALETLTAPITLIGTAVDDGNNAGILTPIGFTFSFAGTSHTTFNATSNGLVRLGAAASTAFTNSLAAAGGLYPQIAPWWDDLHTGTNGSVRYQLVGTSPSQRLVIEWNVSNFPGGIPFNKTFQVWLHQTSNTVQFVYGSMTLGTNSSSIGIASAAASPNFHSVSSATNTSSTVAINNANSSLPVSGRSYIFTTSGCAPPAPANDACTTATVITCATGSIAGSTATATADAGVPTCAGTGASSPGVWYNIVGTGLSVTLNTCTAPAFDTQISVFTGTCGGVLTPVACNDDFCGLQSSVTFTGVSGTTFRIFVNGFGASTGTFTLSVSCSSPLANDVCTGAIGIACPSTTSGTTVGGTTDAALGACAVGPCLPSTGGGFYLGGTPTIGVWYSVVGTGGTMSATTCGGPGTLTDTKLHVYTGTCAGLSCIASNDDASNVVGAPCATLQSYVCWPSTLGTTYRILVNAFGAATTGTFTLTTVCCPIIAVPTVGPVPAICGIGSVTVTATAGSGGDNVRWFTAPTGGTLVATGTSVSLPVGFTSATFYAETFLTSSPTCVSSRVAVVVAAGGPFVGVTPSALSPVCESDGTSLSAGGKRDNSFTNTTDFIADGAIIAESPIVLSATGTGADIVAVVINISTSWTGDASITLIAPNLTTVDLSSGNGGSGDNFTNTIFITSAATSITAGTAPFTGMFKPEAGSFAAVAGSSLGGTWTLRYVDNVNDGGIDGTLLDWTLIARTPDNLNYAWSPTLFQDNLDGTGFDFPPTGSTAYSVTATDALGSTCSATGGVTVDVGENPSITYTSTPTTCAENCDGTIDIVATGGTGNYLYIIDGANTTASASNSDLCQSELTAFGDYVIAVIDDNLTLGIQCLSNIEILDLEWDDDIPPTITCPANIILPSCVETATWDDPAYDDNCIGEDLSAPSIPKGSSFANGTTTEISYTVTDTGGNEASCSFTVERRALLTVNAGPDENSYFGLSIDQFVTHTAVPAGGLAPYSYSWTGTHMNNASAGLLCNQINGAGDESFTVSSPGGCSGTNVCPAAGNGPVPVCTGSATVTVLAMDTMLVCVTVTDAEGCTATDCFIVYAEDARCFAGNSGNVKLKICHMTGSANNPCHVICVNESAWLSHQAHGDNPGKCNAGCLAKEVDGEVDFDEAGSLLLFPNPTNGLVVVDFEGTANTMLELTVTNIYGQIVYSEVINDFAGHLEKELDLTNNSSGAYLIQVRNGDNFYSEQIVVTQ